MKSLRFLLVIALIAIVVAMLWNFAPGCRQKATDAYRKYGGWTEDARRADPVRFIEYAEKKLDEDLAAFRAAETQLAGARDTVDTMQEDYKGRLAVADELAPRFRDAYQEAEAGGAYPVEVAGAAYSRDELIEQVGLLLAQKRNYEGTLVDLAETALAAEAKAQQLITQISRTKAVQAMLPAKREIARIDQLTAETQDLLVQVDELLNENKAVIDSPIRTVEELTAAPAETGRVDVDVEAFLRGDPAEAAR